MAHNCFVLTILLTNKNIIICTLFTLFFSQKNCKSFIIKEDEHENNLILSVTVYHLIETAAPALAEAPHFRFYAL